MIHVHVQATDDVTGDEHHWHTNINTDIEDARDYFIGRSFNVGGIRNPEEDRMVTPYQVEELTNAG